MKSRKRAAGRKFVKGQPVEAGRAKAKVLKVHKNGSVEVKFGEDKGTTPDMHDKSKVKPRKDSKGTFSPYAVSLVENNKPSPKPKHKKQQSQNGPMFF